MAHIATKYTFDELVNGLENEVREGNVIKKTKGNLVLYNYNSICLKEWTDFTLSARGLILDVVNKKIIALPFPKFFNYGEQTYDIPKESFVTTEKLDGSLGIIYFYNKSWQVSTRGSFESTQSKWAENWLNNFVNLEHLKQNTTYLAEIIYPENRIVVKYNYSGLSLLSAFNNITGEEYRSNELDQLATDVGFSRPEYYVSPFEELLNLAQTLPATKEGFVVRFDNGFRFKIKGDEYCRVHRLLSKVTPLGIWNCLIAKDNLNKIKKVLPEEYHIDFDNITSLLQEKYKTTLNDLKKCHEKTKHLSDKEVGLSLSTLPPVCRSFIFSVRKKDNFLPAIEVANSPERIKFFKFFRPTKQILKGYTPTSVINRFI